MQEKKKKKTVEKSNNADKANTDWLVYFDFSL